MNIRMEGGGGGMPGGGGRSTPQSWILLFACVGGLLGLAAGGMVGLLAAIVFPFGGSMPFGLVGAVAGAIGGFMVGRALFWNRQ